MILTEIHTGFDRDHLICLSEIILWFLFVVFVVSVILLCFSEFGWNLFGYFLVFVWFPRCYYGFYLLIFHLFYFKLHVFFSYYWFYGMYCHMYTCIWAVPWNKANTIQYNNLSFVPKLSIRAQVKLGNPAPEHVHV